MNVTHKSFSMYTALDISKFCSDTPGTSPAMFLVSMGSVCRLNEQSGRADGGENGYRMYREMFGSPAFQTKMANKEMFNVAEISPGYTK